MQLLIEYESVSCTQCGNLGLLPETADRDSRSGVLTQYLLCGARNRGTQPVLQEPDIWLRDNEIIMHQEAVN